MTSRIPSVRTNELTAVVNRDRFEDPPADLRGERDLDRWLAFRAAYHRAHLLEGEEVFPLQIDFELNSTCDLRCRFCVHGQTRVPKASLSFEDFSRVILEAEPYGLCSVKLNYINEPLLNPDLPRFAEYAKAHGVLNTFFATNGIRLTEETGRRLIEARVNKVMVSLDAATPETFRRIRNSDRFEEIVSNVRAFLALRDRLGSPWPLVRVNFLKTRENYHEARAFVETWTDVADAIGFQEQVAIPGVDEDLSDPVVHEKSVNGYRCAWPYKLVTVDSSGSILPCCTFSGRAMPLGSLRGGTTIAAAWTSPAMTALRRAHRGGTWEANPICRHCIRGGA